MKQANNYYGVLLMGAALSYSPDEHLNPHRQELCCHGACCYPQ